MNKHLTSLLRRSIDFTPYFYSISKKIKKTEYYSTDQLHDLQNNLLLKIVNYSYENVPYYTELFNNMGIKPSDIKTVEDLKILPYIDKGIMQINYDKLLSKKMHGKFNKIEMSSGTTGMPAKSLRDFKSIATEKAFLRRFWKNSGDPGYKRITLRGDTIVPSSQSKPPFWEKYIINNEMEMSSYHLTKENIQYYIDEIIKFNPKILNAYPSTAYLLARNLIYEGIQLPLNAVFTSSEILSDEQREVIENTFQCRVFDWYGQAERVSAIGQCEFGMYHVIDDYSITEFIETQEGLEIVGTHLYNYSMPLLRYRTNDIIIQKNEKCGCGRSFRTIDKILGRKSHFFKAKNGRILSGTGIPYFVKIIKNIKEYQVMHRNPGEIIINLSVFPEFTEKDRLKIISMTKDNYGYDTEIILNIMDNIPRGSNGKLEYFINELNKE